MIDLGWACYGETGPVSHLWQFDQRIGLLRSRCHAVWRRTETCGNLFVDDSKPRCRHCLKKAP